MSTLDERYDIEEEIGRGPSAYVFKATDTDSSKIVALKHLEAGNDRVEQFPYVSEWDKIASLDHPAILKMYDHIEEDGEKYIISEFAKGETLNQRIQHTGGIPEADCVSLFRSIAMGLSHCHDKGLLHLNLKPTNIFLSEDENGFLVGKIADFGQWTMGIDQGPESTIMAFYKSPEQRRGSGIMVASDVYAFGKLLYVAISGETNGRISPTALPEQCHLQEMIYSSIRTRMEDRFQSMEEIIQDLDRIEAEFFADAAGIERVTVRATQPSGVEDTHSHPLEVSISGHERATSEIQGMLIASRSHLASKKLLTCRKLIGDADKKIESYAEFQGEDWAAGVREELDVIDDELSHEEAELRQLVASAEEAFNDARFEDVQMLATAAAEVSSETTGCEVLADEASKSMANIQTFMEDAFKSLKLKEFRRAEIDLIKVLEINPNHTSALQMRIKVKSAMRRQKLGKLALKTLPLLLVIVAIAGVFLYFQKNFNDMIDEFNEHVKAGRARDAEVAAQKIVNRHDMLKKLFGDYKEARQFLEGRGDADMIYSSAVEAQTLLTDEEQQLKVTKGLCDTGSQLLVESESKLAQGDSEEAIRLAEEAKEKFQEAFLVLAVFKSRPLFEEGKWQQAHDLLKAALDIREDANVRKLYTLARSKLVPELTVDATVAGKRAKGAIIYVDGKLMNQVTPAKFLLDIGKEHMLTVLLPPRGDKYYKPVSVPVLFTSKEARSMTVELDIIPGPAEEKPWTVDAIDLTLMPVPAGTFQMGDDNGDIAERPQHSVEISYPFWMGKYEVTRAQYLLLMTETKPSESDAKLPANKVTWSRAREFCRQVTLGERRNNRIPVNYEYRLPTEAEWEYACRIGLVAGAEINEYAWHAGNSGGNLQEIGTKEPNNLDIYDMQGNVAEWCADRYSSSVYIGRKNGAVDPTGPSRGTDYVYRGGSFISPPQSCRPFKRYRGTRKERKPSIGFRLVLAPTLKALAEE